MNSRSFGGFFKCLSRRSLFYQYYPKCNVRVLHRSYQRTDVRTCSILSRRFEIEYARSANESRGCSTATTTVANFDNVHAQLLSHIATDIKTKRKVHHNDVIKAFKNLKSPVSVRDGTLLLKCCSSYLFEVSSEERMKILDDVWGFLQKNSDLTTDHFNELLQCYIDNEHKFTIRNFIQQMFPCKPNNQTYLLLLKSACSHGDVNQMTEVLENIKSTNIPFTEDIFCQVIEGYARNGDIITSLEILNKMKSMSIPITAETDKALLKAYILSNDIDGFRTKLSHSIQKEVRFNDDQALEIIECLVQKGNFKVFLPECFGLLPNATLSSSAMSPYLQTFCSKLIFNGHSDSAYFIYSHLSAMDFGPTSKYSVYGRLLLRQSVKVCTSLDEILPIIKGLLKSKRNEYAVYTAYEAAVNYKKHDLAIELLNLMKETALPIRCHFFWPLFVGCAKTEGEPGIFRVLTLMKSFNMSVDNETMTDYIIPFINMTSPEFVLKKFREFDLTLTECITPVILYLIKENKIQEASEICELTEGRIYPGVILFPLVLAFMKTKDANSVHNILRAIQVKSKDTKHDWIGKFCLNFLSCKKWDVDINDLNRLVMILDESETKISVQAVERCVEYLNGFKDNDGAIKNLKAKFSNMLDLKFEDEQIISSFPVLTKQQSMSTLELEGHLVELEANNLNSRGVMRKLFQQYCQHNELDKAKQFLDNCVQKKIKLSSGMMASAFGLFLKLGDMQQAESYLNELTKSNSKFELDDHKIVDYATLLVKNGQISKAFNILETNVSKKEIKSTTNIEANCRLLLLSVGENYDASKVEETLTLLNRLGYCKFSNIILGTLVRSYLDRSDINGAVNQFLTCAKKYKRTPLKHEILTLLVAGSSGKNESSSKSKLDGEELAKFSPEQYQEFLVKVQAAERQVHGSKSSQISLICAFADMNLAKPLRNLLLNPSLDLEREDLFKCCEKFANENKLHALMTIVQCLEGLKKFNALEIYELMMKTHSRNSSLDEALKLWNKLDELNLKPSKNTAKYLANMLKSHKMSIPDGLLPYVDDCDSNVKLEAKTSA